jgi:hypothetical protein
MKKTFTVFLALVTVIALAVPSLAKGGKPDKPDDPDSAPKVTLSIEANLWQAHEVDDLIIFTIDVVNNSGETVFVDDTLPETEFGPLAVADGGTLEGEELDYYVLADDFVVPEGQDDLDPIVNTLIAKDGAGNVVASATAESGVTAYQKCDDDGDGVFTSPDGYSVCIWQPGAGDWALKVTPADESAKRGLIAMNLRDHVPGNWCPFTDENGDPLDHTRWRGTPPTLTFRVDVPSPGDHWNLKGTEWHGEPICPNGGAGGAPFDVGTSGSFYLATYDDYRITTTP